MEAGDEAAHAVLAEAGDARAAAATRIQAAQRGKAARQEVAALRRQVSTVTNDDMQQQALAATKIQAAQRGKAARQEVAAMRAAAAEAPAPAEEGEPEPDGGEVQAATKIQAAQRGKAARKEVAARKEEAAQTAAATKIQAAQRGKAARKEVAAMRGAPAPHEEDGAEAAAAIKIQAAQRGRQARKQVKEMRTGGDNVVVAAPEAGVPDGKHLEVDEQTAAVTKIQAAQRAKVARREVAAMREAKEAEEAGAAAPSYMQPTEEMTKAATKIQSVHRGRQARKETNAIKGKKGPVSDLPMDVQTLETVTEAEEAAALKIQSVQRGRQARRDFQQRQAEAAAGPQKEQVVMGSYHVDIENVEYTDEHTVAVVRIQAVHRGRQARHEVEKLRQQAHEEEAATRIQAVHRGRQARKQVAVVRAEAHAGASEEEALAACTITKHFRGFKARKEVAEMRMAMRQHISAEVREMVSARLDNALANYLTRSVLNLQETLDAALAAPDRPVTLTPSKAKLAISCHVARTHAMAQVLKMAKIDVSLAVLILTNSALPSGRELALQVARHTACDNIRKEWTSDHVAAMLTKATGLWQYEQVCHARALTGTRILKLEFHCMPMLGIKQWDHAKVYYAFIKAVREFCVFGIEYIPSLLDWRSLIEM